VDTWLENPEQAVYAAAIILVVLAWVSSLRAFFYEGTLPLRMFSVACLLTVLAETLGYLLRSGPGAAESNHWVYNVYHFLYFMLMGQVYYHQLSGDLMRSAIQLFRVAFTVFFSLNCFFWQGLGTYQTITVVVGGSFIMILAVSYFWELLVSQDNNKITRDPFFWFSFALIVFYGGTVPFLGMLNYLSARFYDFTVFYQVYIFNGFTIFLNSLIVIGFLCRKNFQK
jgi:hypothetical protein